MSVLETSTKIRRLPGRRQSIHLLANLQHERNVSIKLAETSSEMDHPLKALDMYRSSAVLVSYLLLVD